MHCHVTKIKSIYVLCSLVHRSSNLAALTIVTSLQNHCLEKVIDELFCRGLRMSKTNLKTCFSINCYSFENLDQDDEVRDRELFEYLLI